MEFLRTVPLRYWLNLLAIGAFAMAAVKYCLLADAFDLNEHLIMLLYCFGSLVVFIFSDSWSDWIGDPGLPHSWWVDYPPWLIRLVGGACLIYFTVALCTLP